MNYPEQPQTWWQSMSQHFPWKQFTVGALIPILIFYLFHRFDQPLMGAALAVGWSVGVVTLTHLLFKKINLFAALSIPITLIEIAGIVVTLNPDFYLATAAIEHTLWGFVCLGSVAFSRPLILIFAQAMGGIEKPQELGEFGKSNEFRSAWIVLTIIWGITHLIAAIALIASQMWLPLELFLILRTILGTPLLAALIAFSFWFPRWYWKRS
ncbi:MAG: VC0807 family protein [Leptolyngbyaceae cyanobacterium]